MQKMTTCLWFDDKAEEAVEFYTSVFKNSKIHKVTRYGKEGAEIPGRPKEGTVMTIAFEINGQSFLALNGGPIFKFNESISLVVNCETQEEIDYLWEKLSAHRESEACGWLKDKFGLSWQIVPAVLQDLLDDKASEKSERVIKAILKMKKIYIETLKKAYAG